MALDFGLFKRIHSLLRQQTDLTERLQRSPKRIQMVENNKASFLKVWETQKDLTRQTQKIADTKQAQLDDRESKMKDLQFRLNTASSNKEFQLLKERIEAYNEASSVQQDEILEMLERLDQLHQTTAEAKSNFEKASLEADKSIDKIHREIASLELDLAKVKLDLADAEKKLPSEIINEYRRNLKGMGENVLGMIEGENCGNCFQKVTAQMGADLRMQRAVYCQGCGCLLYESHAVRPQSD